MCLQAHYPYYTNPPHPHPHPHRCRLQWQSWLPLQLPGPCLAAHAAARPAAHHTGQGCCGGGGRWPGPAVPLPGRQCQLQRCCLWPPLSRWMAAAVCTLQRWRLRLRSSCRRIMTQPQRVACEKGRQRDSRQQGQARWVARPSLPAFLPPSLSPSLCRVALGEDGQRTPRRPTAGLQGGTPHHSPPVCRGARCRPRWHAPLEWQPE